MTRHAPLAEPVAAGDAPRQLAQLRRLLLLVEEIAGRGGETARSPESELDEAARIGAAHGQALPVLQRRFDALVAETAAWAAAGVEALTLAGGPRPAAARLADELAAALEDLLKLLKL